MVLMSRHHSGSFLTGDRRISESAHRGRSTHDDRSQCRPAAESLRDSVGTAQQSRYKHPESAIGLDLPAVGRYSAIIVNEDAGLDTIFEIASRQLPAAGIDCLLIGGFAVNHYGYTRSTLDVDFMIVSDRLEDVRRIMESAGFTNIDIQENVAFFSTPGGGLRADFLRVDSTTMRKLMAKAGQTSVRGRVLRLPALKDLLAMKIFAFAQNPARRMGKDLPDIAYLSVIHNLDLEKDVRPLCKRFGTPEACRMIQTQIESLRET